MTDSPIIDWLTEIWPAHDWSGATVHKGCFHHVAVTGTAVARISCHGSQPLRLAREHATLTAVGTLALPLEHPRPLSPVIEDSGRSAMLVTAVPGEERSDAEWPTVADELGRLLNRLHAVDATEVATALAPPRSWCGGTRWPEIVEDHVIPRLPTGVRDAARAVVADLLTAEQGARTTFIHGDFGPHNILWHGETIRSIIDFDHSCLGDPAIDLASLISFYGAEAIRTLTPDEALLARAQRHRATFPLQLAAAAVLVDDPGLLRHATGNFTTRLHAGTLHDPHGSTLKY